LFFISKAQPGETVLVHAAASGVGTALIQLAALRGIKTIAVSSSDDKLEVCSKFGASATVNYKSNPDWEKEVLAITGGKGVEIVTDPIGA
jgi:NADPH:quinone reductase-like Zn-dependent oxidoreductase